MLIHGAIPVSLADACLSLMLESHEAERERVEVQPVVDVRKHLHDKQREVFDCDAVAVDILGGRQGGKTFLDVGFLIEGGMAKPGTINPYFGLTGASVGDIMWPEVVTWWKLLGFDPDDLHQHVYTAKLPNGSLIKGRGTDDRKYIESKRGAKYNHIVIDEMGSQPESFIAYFIELLKPTMVKARGRMIRSGNPGLVLSGYWYDRTGPERRVNTPLFHFTAWDNPALGTPDEVDAFVSLQLEDSYGLSIADIRRLIDEGSTDGPAITYQREWLALWIADVGSLVYPFDNDRNLVAALPEMTVNMLKIPQDAWRIVLAADIGFVDACAFVTLCSHPMLPDDYITHAEKSVGMITEDFRARLKQLVAVRKPTRPPRVDMGGMGKAYGMDCIRHGVPVLPAEKTEKRANVRLFRDRLIAGRIKVVQGEAADLLDEWSSLGWDAKRELPAKDGEDHASDAALYGWRDLHNYRDDQEPRAKTQAELDAEYEEQLIAARIGNAHRNIARSNSLRASVARR